jgi:hypothetical protein
VQIVALRKALRTTIEGGDWIVVEDLTTPRSRLKTFTVPVARELSATA